MDPLDLAYAGAARQAELVRSREVSARELVDATLARIERIDPHLRAFRVVLAERARADADRIDAADGDEPLRGVPVAIKDNVDVEGVVTTNGSATEQQPAAADAELVRRLRAAGAIVIGKTRMPELAIFPFTESAAFGYTHNPWDPGRSAGGSSGGSAVAVAAGMCGIASATDGGGSIRIPAAACGLFGLKPQRGRVPVEPPEHWYGLTAAGSVARTVLDAALYLDAATGERRFAAAAARDPGRLRVALSFKPSTPAPLDARVREAVERVAELLRSLGHTVERADPDYGQIAPAFMPRWLRGIRDDVEALPSPHQLERRTRALERVGGLVSDGTVSRARRGGDALTRRVAPLFERYDVLLTPTLPAPPAPLGRYEGRSTAATMLGSTLTVPYMIPWNVTGQPAASLPAPVNANTVPLATQLVGPPDGEELLLSLSAQLEREIGWPELRPPVD